MSFKKYTSMSGASWASDGKLGVSDIIGSPIKDTKGDDSHSQEGENNTLVMHILIKINDDIIFESVWESKRKVEQVKRWYLIQNGL